nr:sel1 repeat family protein [Novosphingobium terrae]
MTNDQDGRADSPPVCTPAQERSAQEWVELLSGPLEHAAKALQGAAEAGLGLAQLYYGQCLLDGRGVARDARVALTWFHRAAQAGLPMAMNMVGRCFDQGWGVREDPAQAAPWFRAAADQGLDWGLYNLAGLLSTGRGIPEDRAEALDLFRRAAAMGHTKSINMVGSFYEDGWAVPRNLTIAAYHYARAAEGGDFCGAFNHARMLIDAGQMAEALPWLESARAGGHARFGDQMAAWLAAREEEPLRALALQWGEQGRA